MVVAKSIKELKQYVNESILESGNKDSKNLLGFVPTMGALHRGHESLIKQSINDNKISVVSIFVNPTQFSPNEDLAKYPRPVEKDLQICKKLGVDLIFMPYSSEIYSRDEIGLNPSSGGYILEGFIRENHFSGVLRVVLKLFNLIRPNNAYFGQKDAQQLLLIQKMVDCFFLNINIIGMPIIRDDDNLAFSSRNIYLSELERKEALKIPKVIFHLQQRIEKDNIVDINILKSEAKEILHGMNIDYLEFIDSDLKFVNVARNCIFVLAVRVGGTRLLDNLWIK